MLRLKLDKIILIHTSICYLQHILTPHVFLNYNQMTGNGKLYVHDPAAPISKYSYISSNNTYHISAYGGYLGFITSTRDGSISAKLHLQIDDGELQNFKYDFNERIYLFQCHAA